MRTHSIEVFKMPDIIPNVVVSMPSQLFTMPREFKSVFNGMIYIGKIDTDPTIPANQIQVYLENEDGSYTPMPQPIRTNAGGYPVYNGKVSKFVTVEGHSMLIQDANGVQLFYFPNVLKYDPDQLRQELSGPNGAYIVHHGDTTVGDELDKLNNSIITVNVKDYGALGDWNATTLTGTDDTVAIQNAINALAALPDKRHAGKRALFFPQGNYRIKNLVIPASFVFGLNIFGVSRDSTSLYIKPDDPNIIGIDCRIEFVTIDHMSLFGNDRQAYLAPDQVKVLWQSKLPDGRADCDVRIGQDVMTSSCETAFKIYGRGFVMDGGEATNGLTLLEICTDGITFGTSPQDGNNTQTGMRNYSIQNTRFDSVSAAVKVSGTGASLAYINGIAVIGCDFYQSDAIINAPTAVIQDSIVSGNRARRGFANQVVIASRFNRLNFSNNMLANWYNRDSVPPASSNTLGVAVIAQTTITGLIFSGNTLEYPRIGLVQVGSATGSNDVLITGNIIHSGWQFGSFANFINGGNVDRLTFIGNTFGGLAPATAFTPAVVDPAKQTAPFVYDGNISSYAIANQRLPVNLTVKHGSATISPTSIRADIRANNDGYILRCSYGAANTGTGNLSITGFPTAVADLNNISSSYSGGGQINRSIGVNSISRAIVDSTSQSIGFTDDSGSAISTTNLTGNYSIIFEVQYKGL